MRVLLDFLGSHLAQKRNIALCCPPGTPLANAAKLIGIPVFPFFIANLHEKGKFSRLRAAIGLFNACRRYHADVIYVNGSLSIDSLNCSLCFLISTRSTGNRIDSVIVDSINTPYSWFHQTKGKQSRQHPQYFGDASGQTKLEQIAVSVRQPLKNSFPLISNL